MAANDTTVPTSSKRTGVVIGAVVVVLALIGFGVWFVALRDDAPERASGPSCGSGPVEGGSADGAWSVTPEDGFFVGYRITERFGGETIDKTAVGRTDKVSGTMTIDGPQVTKVEINADVTQLKSDSGRRDAYLRDRALETNDHPEATFVATEPVALGATPSQGRQLDTTVKGNLTLRGQTNAVELPVQACWTGDRIEITGSTPIALADYGITAPDISGLVKVADNGELELKLAFRRGV
jgi:polyisoprenoid-binding protein YceI